MCFSNGFEELPDPEPAAIVGTLHGSTGPDPFENAVRGFLLRGTRIVVCKGFALLVARRTPTNHEVSEGAFA